MLQKKDNGTHIMWAAGILVMGNQIGVLEGRIGSQAGMPQSACPYCELESINYQLPYWLPKPTNSCTDTIKHKNACTLGM